MALSYQGNKNPISTNTWSATTAHSLGDIIVTTLAGAPLGQYMICTTPGTTGSTVPAWTVTPFPTIGTTFTDGSVVWTCGGSTPEAGASPIVQLPNDTDPPVAAAFNVPMMSLADQLAFLQNVAALLNKNNTWTGTNNFEGASGDANPALETIIAPTVRKLLWQFQLKTFSGTISYGRLYADISIGSGSDFNTMGLTFTVNASWNGGSSLWSLDFATEDCAKVILGSSTLQVLQGPGSTTFADSAWVSAFALQTDSTLGAGNLTIAGALSAVGGASTVNGLSNLSIFASVKNHSTSGVVGVASTMASTSGSAAVAQIKTGLTSSTNLLPSGTTAPWAGLYRFEVYYTSTSTTAPFVSLTWTDGGNGVQNTLPGIQTLLGTTGGISYWMSTMTVYSANGTPLLCSIVPQGGQTCTGSAALIALA